MSTSDAPAPAPVPPASGLSDERLAEIARYAAKYVYTAYEDRGCTCAEDDGDYPCWYHLNDASRIESLAQMLLHNDEFRALLSRSSEGRTTT